MSNRHLTSLGFSLCLSLQPFFLQAQARAVLEQRAAAFPRQGLYTLIGQKDPANTPAILAPALVFKLADLTSAAGPGWQLLDRTGNACQQWAAFPGWPAVEQALRDQGWQPLSERLTRFLAKQPQSSEARLAWLLERDREAGARGYSGALAIIQFPQAPGPTQAPADLHAQERALQELLKDPLFLNRPGELAPCEDLFLHLAPWLSPGHLTLAREALGLESRNQPANALIWSLLALVTPPEQTEAFCGEVRTADLLGQAWPAGFLAPILHARVAKSPEGLKELESFSQWALAKLAATSGPEGGRTLQQQRLWQALRIWCLWRLDRQAEAEQEVVGLAGSWPVTLAGALLEITRGENRSAAPIMKKLRAFVPAVAVASSSGLPPLSIRLAGSAAWLEQMAAFRQKLWVRALPPAVLRWEPAGAGPDLWMLLDGEQVLAQGRGLPDLGVWLQTVEAARPATLFGIYEFARKHPDHLDIRKTRMERLLPILSGSGQEAVYLEDALRTLAAPPATLPLLTADALAQVGPKLVAALEEALARWPGSAALWKSWIGWSALLGPKVDPRALAARLDWPPRAEEALEGGPVPYAVVRRVMAELMASKQYEAAEAWAAWVWEEGLADSLVSLNNPEWEPADALVFPGMVPDRMGLQRFLEADLLKPWRTAAAALKRQSTPPQPF